MKIILEGTEAEFRNLLHSFRIPKEVVFDDGSQFVCGDFVGRGHRPKKSVRTFKVIKEQFGDAIKDYSSSKEVLNKPEPLEIEFISDFDNDKIKALTKEQANRRREVHQQLNSLKQNIPEAYASRDVAAFPDEVRNQSNVDINKLAEAIKNIPFPKNSSTIRNLKLSELIYLFAERNGGD